MPDLNQILLFIAVLSPLAIIVRTWRRAAVNRSWRLAALIVLVVTAVAWAFAPRYAGFVGGGAWFFLLFLPTTGLRRVADLAAGQRFGAARRIIGLLSALHPIKLVREQGTLLRAMELAQKGAREAALQRLARLTADNSRAARQASAQRFRITGEWADGLAWCEQNIPRVGLGEDPTLLPFYFRVLGECGRREELVQQFSMRAPLLLASPLDHPIFLASLALLLAFCGRTAALGRLFAEEYCALPKEAQEFWIATSLAAKGEFAPARATFERLVRDAGDALIRADTAQRLARRGELAPLPLSVAAEATVARFERGIGQHRSSLFAPQAPRRAPAVWTLIGLNVTMFLAEIALGGSTDLLTLHRLGALEPFAVWGGHQYWRLLTALFLHYGPMHLLVNTYALYILGPRLEATIGSMRFALAYVVAGLGSSAGVLLLWRMRLMQADLLVGASGAVMGIIGLWAGILVGHRHAPIARRQLYNILIIVAIQTAFDLYFPQISMGAHISGLLSGFFLGLFVSPRQELSAPR